ncbi:hypothetical protein CRG98_033524 [Punica granatum]|uniref:Reverse transcriptase RNase H-like domain-containing protein n=1 Tax=Punica granatum TaxID=22663 RepID=A0A2I0IQ05_PUNGR|nr:hypothetical protein CRG98_033524 [Punica granatum]
MTAAMHCLRTWRHYLLGSKFVVRTDNIAMSYFQTQKKLSPKQARWQGFLAKFDFVMEYKPGRTNVMADALSRRVELAAISRLESPLLGRIKEGLQHDAKARILLELAHEGKSRQFWCEDDLVYTKGRRVYVPLYDNLRREILWECHDSKVTKRMKKWADKKRRHVEYSVGDLVLVKLHNILRHKDVHKGLTRRYEGPFQVL